MSTLSRRTADANGGGELLNLVAPFRNILINGGFHFSQRAGSTGSSSYANAGGGLVRGLDRWNFWVGATMASTMSQQAPQNGAGYAMRIARNSGVTTSTNVQITQHIDLEMAKILAGKYVTISFYLRAGANYTGGAIQVQLAQGTAASEVNLVTTGFTGSTSQSTAITPTTSSTLYSVTYLVPSGTSQMALNFFTNGYSGTAGAADWYELEQVMMVTGQQSVPFAMAGNTLGGELSLCQRYFEKTYDQASVATGSGGINQLIATWGDGGGNNYISCNFAVEKRAAPTGVIYNGSSGGQGSWQVTSVSFNAAASVNIQSSTKAFIFQGFTYNANVAGRAWFNWTADAEL
jgi:hypothetical protein